jgi:general stress protein 26
MERSNLMTEKLENIKREALTRLKGFQHIFLATEENDQPRVRPVTLVNFDKRFWVLTGTDNAKVKQIRKNSKMEFCLLFEEEGNQGYIRAAGLANIIKDREIKAKVAKHCDFFSEHWKSPNDPKYTLLELRLNEIEYLRPKEVVAIKFKL